MSHCRPTRTTVYPLVALAALAACSDVATAPRARAARPAAQVVDASAGGNAHFAWLPPTVPAAPAPNGSADGSLHPTVVLCEWTGSACGATLGTFSRLAGTAGLKVRASGQGYALTLPTGRLGLTAGRTYRASVSLFRTEVGAIDIAAVGSAAEAAAVDASQWMPAVVGTQLTLAFRLEKGVVYLVEPTGTTVTSLDDPVTLAVPGGAVADEFGATIRQSVGAPAPGAGLTLVSAYELGPSSVHFATPAQLSLGWPSLPQGTDAASLTIYQLVGGAWTAVPGSAADLVAGRVSAPIGGLGTYAVLARSAPAADPTLFTQVIGGTSDYGCGLKGTTAYCWGFNSGGILGTGVPENEDFPTPVAGGIAFTQLSSMFMACGLDAAGAAYCWGYNGSGEIGTGSVGGNVLAPSPVAGGLAFRSISAGYHQACGVTTGGDLYCWGASGPITGDDFSYVVYNWGPNHPAPVRLGAGVSFRSVSVSESHACALAADGTVYCWGLNQYGQLGYDASYSFVPTPIVAGGLTFTSVSVGPTHSCAVATSGVGYCWGNNQSANLGRGYAGPAGNYYNLLDPSRPVVGGHTWETIATGTYAACGITTAHDLFCWGTNSEGELGTGAFTAEQGTPQHVAALAGVTQVSVGYWKVCAIAQSGPDGPGAYCWGQGNKGNVAPWSQPVPTRVYGQ